MGEGCMPLAATLQNNFVTFAAQSDWHFLFTSIKEFIDPCLGSSEADLLLESN